MTEEEEYQAAMEYKYGRVAEVIALTLILFILGVVLYRIVFVPSWGKVSLRGIQYMQNPTNPTLYNVELVSLDEAATVYVVEVSSEVVADRLSKVNGEYFSLTRNGYTYYQNERYPIKVLGVDS